MRFLKYKSELDPSNLFFNVVVIHNYYPFPIKGKLEMIVPDEWNIISNKKTPVDIAPNDSILVPIRLSGPPSVKGGVSYPVVCKLTTEKKQKYNGTFYILKPSEYGYSLSLDKRLLFLNSVLGTGAFNLSVKNSGNIDQLIKLKLEVGELLRIDNFMSDSGYQYVALPAGKDTTLRINVAFVEPQSDKKYLMSRISESTILIKAYGKGNEGKQLLKDASIWCRFVPSRFANRLNNFNTPLNIALYGNGLIADSPFNLRADIYGSLLINKDNDLSYFISLLNYNPGLRYETLMTFK